MPRYLLLIAVLVTLVLAARSMLRAIYRAWHDGIARELDGEEPDFDSIPDEPDAEWLHQRLVERLGGEREGWAVEQLERIDARLQAGVPPAERLKSVLLWLPEANAFAAAGRYVYVSRRLLERAPGDEAVALLVAHEFAHHHLGHLPSAPDARSLVNGLAGDLLLVRCLMNNAQREEECDRHAFNLCLKAGYEPHACLKLFDLLESFSLDAGDREGVFGSDAAIAAAVEEESEWKQQLHAWLAQHRRGYRPLRERKRVLLEAYEEALAAAHA